jgi:hypothetical protein
LTDFVIDSTDAPTLQALAQAMGFWDAAANSGAGAFKTQGPILGDPNPQASYFLNVVGTVAGQPGYWSRLRINGLNPFASGLLTVPVGLTVYPPEKFLADGVTLDPNYTQPAIGDIA